MQMPLYESLVERKRRGEILDIKDVTAQTLLRLWWNEECSDATIADLYGVKQSKVYNLRKKWDIKFPEVIVNEFLMHVSADVSTLPNSCDHGIEVGARKGEALIQRLRRLNDLELDLLRVELEERFPELAHLKTESAFLDAVETTIRLYWNAGV